VAGLAAKFFVVSLKICRLASVPDRLAPLPVGKREILEEKSATHVTKEIGKARLRNPRFLPG